MNRSVYIALGIILLAAGAFAKGGNVGFELKSSAFDNGGHIPEDFTCDGTGQSPPLEWEGAPPGTKAFALIADDPDAPGGTWTHWLLFNVPGSATALQAAVSSDRDLKDGSKQGKNDFQNIGYGGPCPPGGTHRYYFRLFALNDQLSLKSGASRPQLETALKGHVIGQAQVMGTYTHR
jgi:Raf kinase inhibitor-like YbhB/YbcL family protein